MGGADGPYIFRNEDGSIRFIQVSPGGNLKDTTFACITEDFSFEVISNDGSIAFDVQLHPIERPQWQYAQPDSIFVLSDPHGRLDLFADLLLRNGIVDQELHWKFGTNHLMIIGDIFDRGKDVTQLLWLAYRLEAEASAAGGNFSFVYGNHETMVLAGDTRYTKDKYAALADTLNMTIASLYGRESELGRWLASRNTIQVIGKELFVHAGISDRFCISHLDIPALNETVSSTLFMTKAERKAYSLFSAFLYGNEGPIWHRGLVRTKKDYFPTDAGRLKRYMAEMGVVHIIVGHTIFKNISTFYKGRVIAVNVDNSENKKKGRDRALLITKEGYFKVRDAGLVRLY
ncbi:MAG: metallophosphatase [Bacteroidales bacterium]|nr:metallophosphatase [Bacteroidales bacterium]